MCKAVNELFADEIKEMKTELEEMRSQLDAAIADKDATIADMDAAIVIEEKLFGDCFETEDQQAAMANFLEKDKEKKLKVVPFKNM